jgi:uncharacterized protein (DUF111 family)
MACNADFPEQANVLRIIVGNTTEAAEASTVAVIEANIDDSSPRFSRSACLEAGASDEPVAPLTKKNRPGAY